MTLAKHETFCIYCQIEFGDTITFREHIRKAHPGTYRILVIE